MNSNIIGTKFKIMLSKEDSQKCKMALNMRRKNSQENHTFQTLIQLSYSTDHTTDIMDFKDLHKMTNHLKTTLNLREDIMQKIRSIPRKTTGSTEILTENGSINFHTWTLKMLVLKPKLSGAVSSLCVQFGALFSLLFGKDSSFT